MAYPFMSAGQSIQVNPKTDYINLFQEIITDQFYNSSDWFTIEEETALASGLYQNVDARVNELINVNTGEKIEDDFKRLLFSNINHSVSLGKMYRFNSNYWVTVNIDKLKTLSSAATIRRCNNILKWIDETTGAIYEAPCSLSYLIKENRDYSTAGSAIVVPSGMIDCIVQFNSQTNKIKPNQRFLFGNSNNWIGYRVEGGGINNFNNLSTEDNMSGGLIKFSLAVDYANPASDDFVNGIANTTANTYSLTLNQSSISGSITQTVQLVPMITLNGATVTRSVVWTSTNPLIATVDSNGLVTFVATGNCVIQCKMLSNTSVNAPCSVSVVGSPIDNYQILVSPDSNYILETQEKTWTMYLYKNGVQQADVFAFTLDPNTVTSSSYTYNVLGGNSFKIKNNKKFLTDVLEISCVSGIHSKTIEVSLKGAW